MQRAIPAMFMRGGTSHGPFFRAADLPSDVATRDRVLLFPSVGVSFDTDVWALAPRTCR